MRQSGELATTGQLSWEIKEQSSNSRKHFSMEALHIRNFRFQSKKRIIYPQIYNYILLFLRKPFSLIVVINLFLLNRFVMFDVCACMWSGL